MAVAKKKKEVAPLPEQEMPPLETKTTKDRLLRVGDVSYMRPTPEKSRCPRVSTMSRRGRTNERTSFYY
jgi:hypothetical protein